MRQSDRWRGRGAAHGAINAGLALIIFSISGLLAFSDLSIGGRPAAAAGKPKMQVLPSPLGVEYRQTVEVKAQNLPKGSGTIALTICGLNYAAADDCAGANDSSGGLVKLRPWKGGTFDQSYTLPDRGRRFAKNRRFCDSTHYCALVVADADPDKPAYRIVTELQFKDQKPRTKPATTTKPVTTTRNTRKTTPEASTTTTAAATTTAARSFVSSVEPPEGSVEPPSVNPPSGSPPSGSPPLVEPPLVEPPLVGPPLVEPPLVEPPLVEPLPVIPPAVNRPSVTDPLPIPIPPPLGDALSPELCLLP